MVELQEAVALHGEQLKNMGLNITIMGMEVVNRTAPVPDALVERFNMVADAM